MRKIIRIILVVTLVFSLSSIAANALVLPTWFNDNLDKMKTSLVELAKLNPAKASSSNPYDYVIDNEYYDAIIELGVDALPYLDKILKSAENYGLDEYICAIAIEEIAQINLKERDERPWTTAREFSHTFTQFVKDLESTVNEILRSKKSVEEKSMELGDLGLLATPYIVEGTNAENEACVMALDSLVLESHLSSNSKMSGDEAQAKISTYTEKVKDVIVALTD